MKYITLPILRSTFKTVVALFTVFSVFNLTTLQLFAASAYIAPQNGFIEQSNFRVNVFVESLETEPTIASTELTINHSANIKVVSIENGEFTNYTQKASDPSTNQIKIAANNVTPTSGKVRAATITFNVVQPTGEATVTIASTSTIVGSGSEQILAETIQGKYILDVTADPIASPTQPQVSVPETGGNDTYVYILVSGALIATGIYAKRQTLLARNQPDNV